MMPLALALTVSTLAPPTQVDGDDWQQLALPELTLDDLAAWEHHVRPQQDELTFERVPWIPEFAAGVRAADRTDKPLLFWAMNGHPLGCT